MAGLRSFLLIVLCGVLRSAGSDFVRIDPPGVSTGYLARLLINENPFPGERGYVSVADSKAGMLQVLHVLDARLRHIPAGYTQQGVAGTRAASVIELITAPKQCEGFSRDARGNPTFAPRVEERLNYLKSIANKGGKPGKFAELLNYGQGVAAAYLKGGLAEADRFAGLSAVNRLPVTGRAYSWMTDMDCYNPGGNFVSIPDEQGGSPGGNRFFTLRKEPR